MTKWENVKQEYRLVKTNLHDPEESCEYDIRMFDFGGKDLFGHDKIYPTHGELLGVSDMGCVGSSLEEAVQILKTKLQKMLESLDKPCLDATGDKYHNFQRPVPKEKCEMCGSSPLLTERGCCEKCGHKPDCHGNKACECDWRESE